MARRRSKEVGGFEEALARAKQQQTTDELEKKKKAQVKEDERERIRLLAEEQEALRVNEVKKSSRWRKLISLSNNNDLRAAIKAWWEKFAEKGEIREIIKEVRPHSLLEVLSTMRLETETKTFVRREATFEDVNLITIELPESMSVILMFERRISEKGMRNYDGDTNTTHFVDFVVIDGNEDDVNVKFFENVEHGQIGHDFKVGATSSYDSHLTFEGTLDGFLAYVLRKVI
jgi:hypothetical protein